MFLLLHFSGLLFSYDVIPIPIIVLLCPLRSSPSIMSNKLKPCFICHVRQVDSKLSGTRQWGHQVVREGERRGHMLHVTCHPSQTWDMSYCFPVFRGVKQLQWCCCHYGLIIYSLKLHYFTKYGSYATVAFNLFRLVPLCYPVFYIKYI